MSKNELFTKKNLLEQIYQATCNGYCHEVADLLCRDQSIEWNAKFNGRSLLHHAGDRGCKRIVELLIQYGADPNEHYGKQNRSLLHFAAATNNFGFASSLLDFKANPNTRTTSGATPLHFAARSGQTYLSIKLVEAGADIDAHDSQNRTPLALAFNKGMTETAKALIKIGAKQSDAYINSESRTNVAESHNSPSLSV